MKGHRPYWGRFFAHSYTRYRGTPPENLPGDISIFIEQIPSGHASLARTLTGLVQDFRFEEIIRLTTRP